MQPRTLLLVLVAGLVSSCGGGGGGGSKKPSIREFTATPDTVGDAEESVVTLTWDVRRADALVLDPFPGAVSGTSITLTLSSPETFTLRAINAKGEDTAVLAVPLSAPIAIAGTVHVLDGTPVPGIPVLVHGHAPVVTQDDGSFVVEGVSPPYDLTVVQAFLQNATTYRSLSRVDPAIVMRVFGDEFGVTSIAGALSPGFPEAGGVTNRICIFTEGGGTSTTNADTTTGNYTAGGPGWDGDPVTTFTTHAFQFDVPSAFAPPSTFVAYGTRVNAGVQDGAGAISAQNVALAAIGTGNLEGTVVIPTGYVDEGISAAVAFSRREVCRFPDDDDGVPGFDLSVPLAPGDPTFQLELRLSHPDRGAARAVLQNLAEDTSGLTIAPSVGPRLAFPIDGVENVTHATAFSWDDDFADGVNVAEFIGFTGNPRFTVVTESSQVRIPDLSAIGLVLPPATTYSWSVQSIRPFDDGIDSFVVGGSLFPLDAPFFEVHNPADRTFVTAP